MTRPLDVVVPYAESNSTVRTRAVEWLDRLGLDRSSADGDVVIHGPGFPGHKPRKGAALLLLRNARRFTRGGYEAQLLARSALGVYDLDDGLPWDDGRLPGLGAWWKRPWSRALVARRSAAAADRVIAGNDVLAEWASTLCHDVRVVPTCIDPDRYRRRESWEIGDRPPVVGWIGSPATAGYLFDIAPALRVVHARTGAQLHVIGAGAEVPDEIRPFTSASPWDLTESYETIAQWDVGVMPLRDGVYERAKCGYKLLQYAAAAVPAIGSPVGVNRELLGSMAAPSPSTHDEWIDALCDVIGAPQTRRAAMAAAGRDVAQRYSYDHWESAWLDAVGLAPR
jgi:glycosyltransferase involved in cell wall biosynthesis